jgi:CubicO group peptidase (beta-lactamase class C family)
MRLVQRALSRSGRIWIAGIFPLLWLQSCTALRADHAESDSITQAKAAVAGFDGFVDEAIKKWEVPGLALAIVKDGQVVLSRGFGFRDVKNKRPVTSRTLFAIGSCSKAFTTFVMGTLVDEGKLDWDTPLRTYIPELRMFDRTLTELITPRDLVTHRSGLPRHDALWYNATLSRKQIVDRLPYLEPSEPLRNKFQYNNIMYMTAGYLVERLTGKTWEDAVRARVFEPLGMTNTNFSVQDSQKSADHARPYDDRDDKIVEIPFRDISNAGPAGSINSCVDDMAQWLVVQTHKGDYGSRSLISPAVLADVHSPHMTMSVPQERKEIAPAGYGLGWLISDYRGHRRVSHGGAIDGFTAQTTLFPDDGLGIVALANMNGTALPEMLTRHAVDQVLHLPPIDWSGEELDKKTKGKAATKEAKAKKNTVRKPGTSPAHKLQEYAGDYEHPGYGLLRVELRDGKLAFRYNDMEAELEHWHFEVFNGLKNPKDPALENQKLQFLTNLKGDVESVAANLEPAVKAIVFTKRPDAKLSDPQYLKRFVGQYELAGRTLHVRIKGTTVVIDSPGQATITLLPDHNDEFNVKEQSETSVRFVAGKDPAADELSLSTPEGVFTAKRKKN